MPFEVNLALAVALLIMSCANCVVLAQGMKTVRKAPKKTVHTSSTADSNVSRCWTGMIAKLNREARGLMLKKYMIGMAIES